MRREAVAYLTSRHGISQRRACRLIGQARSNQFYRSRKDRREGLRLRMKEIANTRIRFGYRRVHVMLKRQRTIVGRLQRAIERKLTPLAQAARDALAGTLTKGRRVFEQTKGRTSKGESPKLYSWHEPEVHCFSKGKAHTPFEFGTMVGIAVTAKGNFIVGA